MEGNIYFGRVGSYVKDNETYYTVDYMSESGATHRENIDKKKYDYFKGLDLSAGELVSAVFDVDVFNRATLNDIKI